MVLMQWDELPGLRRPACRGGSPASGPLFQLRKVVGSHAAIQPAIFDAVDFIGAHQPNYPDGGVSAKKAEDLVGGAQGGGSHLILWVVEPLGPGDQTLARL